MATEVIMPALGMAQETGVLVSWLKAEGETVAAGEPLMEIETDKAVVEVEAPASGILSGILVHPGDEVPVGQVIAYVCAPGEAAPAGPPAQAKAPPAAAAAQSDAAPPVPATRAGGAAVPAPRPAVAPGGPRVPASPKARRLAREQALSLEAVTGSGPHGAVLAADVLAAAQAAARVHPREGVEPGAVPPAAGPLWSLPAPALPDFTQWGGVRREALSNVRRVIAQRMHLSWVTIPQVTSFDKADVTELERWRQGYSVGEARDRRRVPVTAVVLKVVAAALRRFPVFGASFDAAQQEVVYKDYVHIGVAVDTERGLLVPVIQDVDRKNVTRLAVELAELAEKARARKLTPEDMQGGCFTVSNLGGIGGVGFTPIINPPEVALLGVARAAREPVWVDDAFVPRLMMPLSLTYDHRLIDGADGARFLRWVAQALENPWLMLAEG